MEKSWPNLKDIHTIAFDFDGVLTNNKVWVNAKGDEWVCCDRADGLAFDILRKLVKKGFLAAKLFILSTETNPVVAARAKKLKIECYQGISSKKLFLIDWFSRMSPNHDDPFKGLIYLGNDLNDLEVIESGCFSVAPVDAHSLVKEKASVVLTKNGGDGFVREFVEEWVGGGLVESVMKTN